jgi:hypothetical protein
MIYDGYDVTVGIINTAKAIPALVAKIATVPADLTTIRIHPKHISLIQNPVYPCITLGQNNEETLITRLGEQIEQVLDVWSKVSYDELWEVYRLIRNGINLKTLVGCPTFVIRQTYVNPNLFEEITQVWHLAARYKVIA